MSNEPLALPEIWPGPPDDADYDAIYAALLTTERGRLFLAEHASRNRRPEAQAPGVASVQPHGAGHRDLVELAAAINRIKAEIVTSDAAESNGLAATERLQDIAFALRERDIDTALCDALDAAIREISVACALNDAAMESAHKSADHLCDLAGRITDLIALWIASDSAGPPAGETMAVQALAAEPEPAPEPVSVFSAEASLVERINRVMPPHLAFFANEVVDGENFAQTVAVLAAGLPARVESSEPSSGPPSEPAATIPPLERQTAPEPAIVELVSEPVDDAMGRTVAADEPHQSDAGSTPLQIEPLTAAPSSIETFAEESLTPIVGYEPAERQTPADMPAALATEFAAVPAPPPEEAAVVPDFAMPAAAEADVPPEADAAGYEAAPPQSQSLAPESLVPESPVPESLAPEIPTLASPVPESLATESLATESLAPECLAPESLAPESPAPESLAPESLAPESLAPESLVSEIPAPESLAPESVAPESVATECVALESIASESPAIENLVEDLPDAGSFAETSREAVSEAISSVESPPDPDANERPPVAESPSEHVSDDSSFHDETVSENAAGGSLPAELPSSAEMSAEPVLSEALADASALNVALSDEAVPTEEHSDRHFDARVDDDGAPLVSSHTSLAGDGHSGAENPAMNEPAQPVAHVETTSPMVEQHDVPTAEHDAAPSPQPPVYSALPDMQPLADPQDDPGDLFEPLPLPSPLLASLVEEVAVDQVPSVELSIAEPAVQDEAPVEQRPTEETALGVSEAPLREGSPAHERNLEDSSGRAPAGAPLELTEFAADPAILPPEPVDEGEDVPALESASVESPVSAVLAPAAADAEPVASLPPPRAAAMPSSRAPARPAPNDPLMAVRALSEEEIIALFS